MKIILFGGDNGFQNLGDQAMLLEVYRRLNCIFSGAEFLVLASKPEDVIQIPEVKYISMLDAQYGFNLPRIAGKLFRFNKIRIMFALFARKYISFFCSLEKFRLSRAFFSKKQFFFINYIKTADLIVNYGSGGINDIWGEVTIIQWSLIYRLAEIYLIPTVITGQGIGPIKNKLFERILKKSLDSVAFITLREHLFSADYLRKIGIKNNVIYETADDAIALPIPIEINKVLKKEKIESNENKIGVHIRLTNYTSDFCRQEKIEIALFLDQLGKRIGAKIFFIPLCYNPKESDENFGKEISDIMAYKNFIHIQEKYEPGIIKGIIGSMDINIGFSYHFALFSFSSGIPEMTFYSNDYYKFKIVGLATLFKQQDFTFQFFVGNIAKYVECACSLLEQKNVIKENLVTCQKQLEGLVNNSFERIKPFIKEKHE